MAFPRRIVVLLALLMSVFTASASDRPAVAVQFRVVAFDGTHLYYHPRPKAEREEISLHTSAPSSTCRYEGPPFLELFRSAAAGPPVVVVPLRPMGPRLLLVLPPGLAQPDGAGRAPRAALVIPDDLSAVPVNTVTVLNVTEEPFQLTYDNRRVELAPMGRGGFPARAVGSLVLSARVGGRWRQVTVHDLEVEENARAWVVLWPPYRSGQLQPRLRVMFDQGE